MTRSKRLTKSERKAITAARRAGRRLTDDYDKVMVNREIRRLSR